MRAISPLMETYFLFVMLQLDVTVPSIGLSKESLLWLVGADTENTSEQVFCR